MFDQFTTIANQTESTKDKMSKTRVALSFSLRGPIPIQLEDSYSGAPTGLAVMDLIFTQGESISEVKFRNNYTAILTILVKFDQSSHPGFTPRREQLLATRGADQGSDGKGDVAGRGRMDWLVAVRRRKLMENPHYEGGSQDEVVISASESKVPLEDVVAMRFILRQPSPEWRAFSLEELGVYRETVVVGGGALQPLPQRSRIEQLREQTGEALRGQLVEDNTGSVLLPAKYDVANIHF